MDMTDEIGTRVDPAPVCATPKAQRAIRNAHIDEALHVVDRAIGQLNQVRHGLNKMHDHGSGGVYARSRIREVRDMCAHIDELTIKAEQIVV